MDLERELAPALVILCQEYIIFSTELGLPDINKSDPLYGVIDRALDLMGLQHIYKSGDVASRNKINLSEKIGVGTQLSWWAPLFEGVDSIEHDLGRIIGPYAGQLAQRILNRLRSESIPVEPELSLEIVAPAYIELHDFLAQREKREIALLPKPSVLIASSWQEVASMITRDSAVLYQLEWKKFEDLIAHLLEKFGWSVEPMGYTKDGGIDIIAVRKVEPNIDFRMMVQCKKLSQTRKVGVEVVRELLSVKWENAFHQAMIATSSSFTKEAVRKADIWNLELRDHRAIADWCKKYGEVITPKHV